MDPKITITQERIIQGNIKYIEGFFETGATLPTEGIATGSNLLNVDTLVPYFFKASTGEWSGETGGGEE